MKNLAILPNPYIFMTSCEGNVWCFKTLREAKSFAEAKATTTGKQVIVAQLLSAVTPTSDLVWTDYSDTEIKQS